MRNPMIFFKGVSKTKIDQSKVRKVLRAEGMSIAADMMLDLLVTTATWEHNVKFKRVVEVKGEGITIMVGTDDKIWSWLVEGTPAHLIFPKKAPVLKFRNVYTAKTIPGVLTSKPGGSSGQWRSSKGVIHPGIKARKWDEALAKQWEKKFPKRVEAAIQRALAEAIQAKA